MSKPVWGRQTMDCDVCHRNCKSNEVISIVARKNGFWDKAYCCDRCYDEGGVAKARKVAEERLAVRCQRSWRVREDVVLAERCE